MACTISWKGSLSPAEESPLATEPAQTGARLNAQTYVSVCAPALGLGLYLPRMQFVRELRQ